MQSTQMSDSSDLKVQSQSRLMKTESKMSEVPPKHKHREETEMLIFKGTLRPKFNLYVLCYKFILYLYEKYGY